MSLPSYEATIAEASDVSHLIGPYLETASLNNVVLANKEHYTKYAKYLWEDPMAQIAELSKPFSAAVKFFNGARSCRTETVEMVRVLDFRFVGEMSRKPLYRKDFSLHEMSISCNWVHRHQLLFPNLRVLILDRLRINEENSEYDHSQEILQAAEQSNQVLKSYHGVRYLDGSVVVASASISKVMYLDISHTYRGEDWVRSFQTASFQNLRIIKLRGLRLTDREFPTAVLMKCCLRLWSLDIRDNLLRDPILEELDRFAFPPYDARLQRPPGAVLTASDEELYESVALYCRDRGHDQFPPYNTLVAMRYDDLDRFKKHLLAEAGMKADPARCLPLDDQNTQVTGLTHLYLSDNKFTWPLIRALISMYNTRLQVLDVGSPQIPMMVNGWSSLNLPHSITFAVPHCASLLYRRSGTRIQRLRINHSLVTQVPTITYLSIRSGFRWDCLKQAENMHGQNPQIWGPPFLPQDNYQISSLSLIDIPTYSYGTIIDRLINFLRQCHAQEIRLAAARTSQHHHRAPPLLSGLRHLRLEFIDPHPDTFFTPNSPDSRSVSGDRDADLFMASGSKDFSFFSETPTQRGSVQTIGKGKERVRDEVEEEGSGPKNVIEELKKFRLIFPRWSGTLQIVRHTSFQSKVV